MRGNGKAAAPWGDAHDLQPRALAASPAAAVVDSRCARETGWARPACACARAHTHTHTHTHGQASDTATHAVARGAQGAREGDSTPDRRRHRC